MPARTTRPVCPPDHAHGASTVCYLHHRCGCFPCRDAQAARARTRRREIAYGTYTRRLVDAEPVRAHVDKLRAAGMGVRTMEAVTGVSRMTISGIVWGRPGEKPSARVTEHTALILLSLRPDLELLADGARFDGRGTRRRLQALARCGWTTTAIARRVDVSPHVLAPLYTSKRVIARSARLVVTIYDALWDKQPPLSTPTERAMAARTRDRAKRLHWHGPLAWDDIDTDPTPITAPRVNEPDDVAVEAAIAGHRVHLTPADRRAAVRILHDRRYSDGLIADTLHCDAKTVGRIRDELNLPAHHQNDLIDRTAA